MGYQFLHLESYARVAGKGKAGGHDLASIAAEAERRPEACQHIGQPQPPTLIFGCMPTEAAAAAQAWAEQASDARGHALRKDGLALAAGVISWPEDRPQEEWPAYRNEAMEWLKKQYGPRLLSIVEHKDEPYLHIHFYAVPLPGERFDLLHPGRAAALQAKAAGIKKGGQNESYKAAMRSWQDDFFQQIASRHGLTRLGPRRRRISRAAWKAEQAAAQLMACKMSRLKRSGELVALAQGNLTQAAKLAEDEAERHKKARQELNEIIMQVKKQDKQRAKEIYQTSQDRIAAGRVSNERQKAWEKRRDEFLLPPAGLSYNQAERRRTFAKEYDFLMWPEDIRRHAVEASRQGGDALHQIKVDRRKARESQNSAEGQLYHLQERISECKSWQIFEKIKLAAELRKIEARIAVTKAEQKRLAHVEKKLISSCPSDVVEKYRHRKEEEREKAIAELLRREAEEAEAERRETTEAKERREWMAMRPAPGLKTKTTG